MTSVTNIVPSRHLLSPLLSSLSLLAAHDPADRPTPLPSLTRPAPPPPRLASSDGLPFTSAVLITTTDYPVRVSFSVLNKVLDEYTSESWSKAVGDGKLAEYVRKYQDPKQADTIMKVQQELDETKIVLVSAASPSLKRVEGAGGDVGVFGRVWRG